MSHKVSEAQMGNSSVSGKLQRVLGGFRVSETSTLFTVSTYKIDITQRYVQAGLAKGFTENCVFRIDKITWLLGYLTKYLCSVILFCIKMQNKRLRLCKCINLSPTVWFIGPDIYVRNNDCMHEWIQRAAGALFPIADKRKPFFHVIMSKYKKN